MSANSVAPAGTGGDRVGQGRKLWTDFGDEEYFPLESETLFVKDDLGSLTSKPHSPCVGSQSMTFWKRWSAQTGFLAQEYINIDVWEASERRAMRKMADGAR